MLDFISNHKKISVIIAVLFILVFPIIVNSFSLWQSDLTVLNNPSVWLGFWGTYLAGIASLGMIIITSLSIRKSSQENKENLILARKNIEVQNKLMEFQVANNNLHIFKKACVDLCDALKYNDLVKICNGFIINNEDVLHLVQLKMDEAITAKRQFLLNTFVNVHFPELLDIEAETYDYYGNILLDLEVVVSYSNQSKEYVLNNIVSDKHSSKELSQIINTNISLLDIQDVNKWLSSILEKRIEIVNPNFIEPLWDCISKVYISEMRHIYKLIESNDTEQNK